jgi:FkbM family methyltransferase
MNLKDIIEFKKLKSLKGKYNEQFLIDTSKYSKVILWGLSESTTQAILFFRKNNIEVNAIYDDDETKFGTKYMEVPIIKPDISCQDKDCALIITCSYYETIRQKIIKYDTNIDDRLFVFDGYFLEDIDDNFYKNNEEAIILCYQSLADDISKDLYIALLEYRYLRDINIIKNKYLSRYDCYYDQVFLNNFRNGLYIDVGSYNADFVTGLKKYKDISNCEFYVFEPNKIFARNIALSLPKDINFQVFNMALCDKIGEMEFEQVNSSTSHLIDKKYNAYNNSLDSNIELVKTSTLDNIINEKKATCIKIDIEGAEQSMINGSLKIINRDRPIILLSIYHKWDDLWNLQFLIKNLNLKYKFYIRHYSLSVAKTILYCIPE